MSQVPYNNQQLICRAFFSWYDTYNIEAQECFVAKSFWLPADWQDWQAAPTSWVFPSKKLTSRQTHRFPQSTHRIFYKLCSTSHLLSVQGTFSWFSPFKLTDGQKGFHFSLFWNHETRVCESLSAHLSKTESDSVPSTPPSKRNSTFTGNKTYE